MHKSLFSTLKNQFRLPFTIFNCAAKKGKCMTSHWKTNQVVSRTVKIKHYPRRNLWIIFHKIIFLTATQNISLPIEDCGIFSKYSCLYFWKNLTWKHILGMQICLKLIHALPKIKSIPLGQKNKRGRPTKAVKPLLEE